MDNADKGGIDVSRNDGDRDGNERRVAVVRIRASDFLDNLSTYIQEVDT